MTQKYIRQIAEMSKLLLTSGGASETKRVDLIMAANVQTALATKVQELSGVFRKKQTAYLRREFLSFPPCMGLDGRTDLSC